MNNSHVSRWREKVSKGGGLRWSPFLILFAVLIMGGFFVANALALTGINITAPVAGEYWSGEKGITWTADCMSSDSVNIYYSTNNFIDSGTKIAGPVPCSPSVYSWNTTGVADNSNYKIKVRDASDT
ncbi:MAG: hypothetical protein L6275_04690, partial [Candidatus Portnoybacteria bacterium]|nr:hypothetical protein [Candidatus Portnoybacteria bacterium]